MFNWHPGARLLVSALDSSATLTSVDTLGLSVLDWRVWMKGEYDSLARARRRLVVKVLTVIGLLSGLILLVRTGLLAEDERRRKRQQEATAGAIKPEGGMVLTADGCTRLLIEEIGRGSHADAVNEARILNMTMLATPGMDEVYQALGIATDADWMAKKPAMRLIGQARRNLLSRIENLLRGLHTTRQRLRRSLRSVPRT